jgi:hypothetical protein
MTQTDIIVMQTSDVFIFYNPLMMEGDACE